MADMAMAPLAAQFNKTELQMIKFLGQGVSQSQVAEVCGVSESYVSQRMLVPAFAEEVQKLKSAKTVQHVDMDRLADNVQLAALERLEKLVGTEYKVGSLLNIVSTMDKMSRRNSGGPKREEAAATVTIVLPPALQHYAVAVDTKNKVIQIGNTTMLPASSGQVMEMAAASAPAAQKGQNDGYLGQRKQAGPLQLEEL